MKYVRAFPARGKGARGYACARSKPPFDASRETSPANDRDPVEAILARFGERSVALLREAMSELRSSQRRASAARPRHVAAPGDIKAAEQVDDLTRARARQILERAARRGGR